MRISVKKICVASDFSAAADVAIHYGAAFARLHGAELHLVHVVHDFTDALTHADFTAGGEVSREYFRRMRSELTSEGEVDALSKTKQFLSSLEQEDADTSTKTEPQDWWDGLSIIRAMRLGDPVEQICHYAKYNQVDLLIVGTHGKTGIRHLLMGSVAERVVRQSYCPVMVVRAHEHDFLKQSDAQ